MKNEEVIKTFLQKRHAKTNLRNIPNGYYTYKGYTLHTEENNIGFCLYNYNTVIAFILDNILYLNTSKYSATTSKIQTQLYRQAIATSYTIKEYKGGEK